MPVRPLCPCSEQYSATRKACQPVPARRGETARQQRRGRPPNQPIRPGEPGGAAMSMHSSIQPPRSSATRTLQGRGASTACPSTHDQTVPSNVSRIGCVAPGRQAQPSAPARPMPAARAGQDSESSRCAAIQATTTSSAVPRTSACAHRQDGSSPHSTDTGGGVRIGTPQSPPLSAEAWTQNRRPGPRTPQRCLAAKSQARLKTSVPFVPPKPKLFLTATSILISRAVLAQ